MDKAARFSGRLRELRAQAGLTQQQLAERTGVGRDAVARWEQGVREPSWSNVIALAEALGVDCTAFLEKPAAARSAAGPGRPRKKPTKGSARPQPKRLRGRPRQA